MGDLIEFFGIECHFCHEMEPILEKLEKETGLKVKKVEVWHNAKNDALRKKLDTIGCGGVPFFYNENTKKGLCGAVPYDQFKKWALGK